MNDEEELDRVRSQGKEFWTKCVQVTVRGSALLGC